MKKIAVSAAAARGKEISELKRRLEMFRDLIAVVQCDMGRGFDTIAAFNVEDAAERYRQACSEAHGENVYRVVKVSP